MARVPRKTALVLFAVSGLTWAGRNEGLGNKSIVSLVLSPDFARDGQIFAASLGGALWSFTEERTATAAKD